MELYYTCIEGGKVKRFPEKISQKNAIKGLKKNRQKYKETGMCLSWLKGWTVHSMFFIDGNMVKKIRDSSLNGYRPIKSGFEIPDKVLKEIKQSSPPMGPSL